MSEFESIQRQVEGELGVAWADQNPGDDMTQSETEANFDLNQLLSFPVIGSRQMDGMYRKMQQN